MGNNKVKGEIMGQDNPYVCENCKKPFQEIWTGSSAKVFWCVNCGTLLLGANKELTPARMQIPFSKLVDLTLEWWRGHTRFNKYTEIPEFIRIAVRCKREEDGK